MNVPKNIFEVLPPPSIIFKKQFSGVNMKKWASSGQGSNCKFVVEEGLFDNFFL
jgi:hypothetical protein